MPRQVISGGTINSVAVGFDPTAIVIQDDGSYLVTVKVTLNGATRVRVVSISADGLTFTLDGVTLSPWSALTTLGAAALVTKINAVFSAPGAVTPLTT